MSNYEKMYYTLFNAITDALKFIDAKEYTNAEIRLAAAQCETEEMYIESQ